MDDLPSLSEIRIGLPPLVRGWVDSDLEGYSGKEVAAQAGVSPNSLHYAAAHVATVAGLGYRVGPGHIREAVLRMRIRELEDMLQERATPLRRAS